LSLEHSFYAVYGVELPGADWADVYDRLEELRRTRSPDDEGEDVALFTVTGDRGPDRVVIGSAYENLAPGTCKPVREFTPAPERGEALRRAVEFLGHTGSIEPGWMLVHDLS
jgi:hypothetical protein